MTAPTPIDPNPWSEVVDKYLGFIERDTGMTVGVLVVIVVVAYFALKLVRAWRGKN